MSRETDEGVMMCFKTITTNLLTIIHLLVEPIKSLAKPKASLEAFIYIRQIPGTVTSSKPVISPSAAVSTISDMTLNSASTIFIGSQHISVKEEYKQG